MDDALRASAIEETWVPIVLLMTWVAGSMDAISYLGPGHVFPANMTGNTALLGIALGAGDAKAASMSLVTLFGYVFGVAFSDLLIHRQSKRFGRDIAVAGSVLIEGALLAIFAYVWHLTNTHSVVYPLIIVAGIAMGMQSASMRRLRLPSIATTYITGTITSMTLNVVHWVMHLPATKPPDEGPKEEQKPVEQIDWEFRLGMQIGVFFVYVVAALVTSLLKVHWPFLVTVSPLVAVGLALLKAFVHGWGPRAVPL